MMFDLKNFEEIISWENDDLKTTVETDSKGYIYIEQTCFDSADEDSMVMSAEQLIELAQRVKQKYGQSA